MKRLRTYTCGDCRSSIRAPKWFWLAWLYCAVCERKTLHYRR